MQFASKVLVNRRFSLSIYISTFIDILNINCFQICYFGFQLKKSESTSYLWVFT